MHDKKPNSSAYNRHMTWKKAIRKKKLDDAIGWPGHPMYDNLHEYSKGKIHCSCPMCSAKSNNKGKRRRLHGNYAPSWNPKKTERARQEAMDAEIQEYA